MAISSGRAVVSFPPPPCLKFSIDASRRPLSKAILISLKPTITSRPTKSLEAKAKASMKVVNFEGFRKSFGGGGAGLLERPAIDLSRPDRDPLPKADAGGDTGRLKHRIGTGGGESYRVLLIDDALHTEQLVEKALPQVVPSLTPNDARKLFRESREKGVAIVIVAVKEHAEFYAQMMIRCGLRSAIEPDSSIV